MKILLLEDDPILNELIEEYLNSLNYSVDVAFDGEEALDFIKKNSYDLLLLDVGVPNINGFELLEYLKELNIDIPTIFITSLDSAKDIEKAFNIGCDDYIKKPFELKELEVRINYIKKIYKLDSSEFKFKNGYVYNYATKSISKDEHTYQLTLKEATILEYFIKNPNKIVSLEELVDNIWKLEEPPTYATIRTYIKNLRKILGKDLLKTLKGLGYKFEI